MNINKDLMEQEARSFIATLFTLPEIEKVQIKDIFISSAHDIGIVLQERVANKEGMRICLKSGVRIDFTCFCRC